MSWAEFRIRQYNQGEKANWLERRSLGIANPVNLGLHVLGAIPLIYGLWIHNWRFIILGVLINGFGHLYCRLMEEKEN